MSRKQVKNLYFSATTQEAIEAAAVSLGLETGELVMHGNPGAEELYIKNDAGDIAPFVSKNTVVNLIQSASPVSNVVIDGEGNMVADATFVNGVLTISKGDIPSGTSVPIVQETGNATGSVMSQCAVTKYLTSVSDLVAISAVTFEGTGNVVSSITYDSATKNLTVTRGELNPGSDINVVQTTGASSADVMSQSAVSYFIEGAKTPLASETGTSEVSGMTQKAITEALADATIELASVTGDSTDKGMNQSAITYYLNLAKTPLATESGTSEVSGMTQKAITELVDKSKTPLATTTGTSEFSGMTQKAITDAISSAKTELENTTGDSETKGMTQSAITEALGDVYLSAITSAVTFASEHAGSDTAVTMRSITTASGQNNHYLLAHPKNTSTADDNTITSSVTFNSRIYIKGSGLNVAIYAPVLSANTVNTSTANTNTVNAQTINATSAVNAFYGFFQTSDERLKNFLGDVEVEGLAGIPKKYFTWKDDEKEERRIGTSAQAVQKVYPELVVEREDGTLAVDYAGLVIPALKAIDLLRDEVKALRKEIDELKKK